MKTIPITPVLDTASKPLADNTTCATSALIAFQVLDSSMAPELNLGQVIVVDRTGKLTEGSLVVVETPNSLLIRCWHRADNDTVELVALNPLWRKLHYLRTEVALKGVVVQRAGRRRADRKRYA